MYDPTDYIDSALSVPVYSEYMGKRVSSRIAMAHKVSELPVDWLVRCMIGERAYSEVVQIEFPLSDSLLTWVRKFKRRHCRDLGNVICEVRSLNAGPASSSSSHPRDPSYLSNDWIFKALCVITSRLVPHWMRPRDQTKIASILSDCLTSWLPGNVVTRVEEFGTPFSHLSKQRGSLGNMEQVKANTILYGISYNLTGFTIMYIMHVFRMCVDVHSSPSGCPQFILKSSRLSENVATGAEHHCVDVEAENRSKTAVGFDIIELDDAEETAESSAVARHLRSTDDRQSKRPSGETSSANSSSHDHLPCNVKRVKNEAVEEVQQTADYTNVAPNHMKGYGGRYDSDDVLPSTMSDGHALPQPTISRSDSDLATVAEHSCVYAEAGHKSKTIVDFDIVELDDDEVTAESYAVTRNLPSTAGRHSMRPSGETSSANSSSDASLPFIVKHTKIEVEEGQQTAGYTNDASSHVREYGGRYEDSDDVVPSTMLDGHALLQPIISRSDSDLSGCDSATSGAKSSGSDDVGSSADSITISRVLDESVKDMNVFMEDAEKDASMPAVYRAMFRMMANTCNRMHTEYCGVVVRNSQLEAALDHITTEFDTFKKNH